MNRKLRLLIGVIVVATATPSLAETQNFAIQSSGTTVKFRLKHMLGSAAGKFSDVRGTLLIDPDHPEAASLTATVAARTIDTANQKRDNHVLSELFEAEKFPEIKFRSTSIKRTSQNEADVTGDLTMHGVTKPFTLHSAFAGVETRDGKEISRWRASGKLRRKDFGLLFGKTAETVFMIGDEVTIDIDAQAVRGE